MAVIPGEDHPIPDGANQLDSIAWMQDVTEDSPKQAMRDRFMPSLSGARNSLLGDVLGAAFGGFLDIINGITDNIPSWLPSSIRDSAEKIRDGQLDIVDRTDLLSPMLDCIHLVGTIDDAGKALHGTGYYPFKVPLAPYQGVEIRPDGGATLLDKGWWNFYVHLTVDWNLLVSNAEFWVDTYTPSGQVYSRKSYRGWITDGVSSYTLPGAVCVPGEGYYIRVWCKTASGRGWLGGPQWSSLIVQHISRDFDPSYDNGTGESSTPDN